MKRNDIVITSENVKKRSCLFKGILIKTTALSGTSSQTCTKVAFLKFFLLSLFFFYVCNTLLNSSRTGAV